MSGEHAIRRVIVYGAGALGSLLGGKLAAVCPVVLVGRAAHMAAIRAHGLRISGLSNQTVTCGERFAVQTRLDENGFRFQPGDAVLLTVKASQVSKALEELDDDIAIQLYVARKESRVLPNHKPEVFVFQNGIGFERYLERPYTWAIAHLGATMVRPGEVEGWGGEILLPAAPAGEALRALLVQAGLQARTVDNIEVLRWKKIAFNCALNPMSALLGVRNNETIQDEWRPLRRMVLQEVRVVAADKGIALPPLEELLDEFETRARASKNVNSMLQDLRRGRATEIEYLNGAILAESRIVGTKPPLGVEAPANEFLWSKIKALEAAALDQHAALRVKALGELRQFVQVGAPA